MLFDYLTISLLVFFRCCSFEILISSKLKNFPPRVQAQGRELLLKYVEDELDYEQGTTGRRSEIAEDSRCSQVIGTSNRKALPALTKLAKEEIEALVNMKGHPNLVMVYPEGPLQSQNAEEYAESYATEVIPLN